MKKPWTLRLKATDGGRPIAYTSSPPRFWTRREAQEEASRRNERASHLPVFWHPVFTQKEPW